MPKQKITKSLWSTSILVSVNKYLQLRHTMLLHFFRFSCHSIFNPNNDDFSVLLTRFSDFRHRNINFTRSPSRMRSNDSRSSNLPGPKFVHLFPDNVVIVMLKGRTHVCVHIEGVIISTDYKTRFHFIVPPVLFASSHTRWVVLLIQNRKGNVSLT